MKHCFWPLAAACLLLVVVGAAPASAQVYDVDYLGFGWEAGNPLKAAGDELFITGAAVDLSPAFGVDLGADELTFYVHGLISQGEVDFFGNTMINYTGGYLEIYQDPAQNAEYGIFPPNLTSPATFTEGTLFFQGAFTAFTMFFDATGTMGSFEGTLNGLGGTLIDGFCTNCVYTWGGAFTTDGGAQIPDGYDLQIDGLFEIDAAVPDETTSWGSVKALFN